MIANEVGDARESKSKRINSEVRQKNRQAEKRNRTDRVLRCFRFVFYGGNT